jgi:hypothetical protein
MRLLMTDILKDGGFMVDLSAELWLLPRTTPLPEEFIDVSAVKAS